MASIRTKLTTAYAAALIGTLAVFSVALWAARRARVYSELEQHVFAQADLALRIIDEAERASPVTVAPDSAIGPIASSWLKTLFAGAPDYVLLLDEDGRSIYASFAATQLSPDDFASLTAAGIRFPTTGPSRFLRLSRERLLVVSRLETDATTPIARVVVGASTAPAELAPRDLLGSILVIAPLVIVLGIGGGYIIAGRSLRPVERIIDEVQAISDGRSLHRRLAVDDSDDELARLSAQLNAMIGRLETSFGALRRFTADASHELRTPLAVLRADVERAMSTAGSSTEQLVALEEAMQETTRMADLVDSLLTLARADEGRFDVVQDSIELEPLARDVFETATILGEDAGISVSLPLVENATVLGDYTRLRQLFLNLVTNAIKYTPRGGRVELRLSRRVDGVSFSVRDTGIGIAAGDLPHIYDRFWRADRVRTRRIASGDGRWVDERGGFGLGLAISQWIAQAHGGSLTASSRLGRGSVFSVLLPLADSTGAPRALEPTVEELDDAELLPPSLPARVANE